MAISSARLECPRRFGVASRRLWHSQHYGALNFAAVPALTTEPVLAQFIFDERAGGRSGRTHCLVQLLLGFCRAVLRVWLADFMGDVITIFAAAHDRQHAIPLRLGQTDSVVSAVLHPRAARHYAEKLASRMFRRRT